MINPKDYLDKIRNEIILLELPYEKFSKTCLIYNKSHYGIFMIEDINENRYTVKVLGFNRYLEKEVAIALYLQKFAGDNPNILYPEFIYQGLAPQRYPIFRKSENLSSSCKILSYKTSKDGKTVNLNDIFHIDGKYMYYFTRACDGSMAQYLGSRALNKKIDFNTFSIFAFQIISGIQTLHALGVYHKDIKHQNILVCNNDKNYSYIANESSSFTDSSKKLSENDPSIIGSANNKSWYIPVTIEKKIAKIIDFGESIVTNEKIIPCKDWINETNYALKLLLDFMWASVTNVTNVTDKDYKEQYDDLISKIQNCSTSLLEVLKNAKIFQKFGEPDPSLDYIPVKIL